MARAAPPRCRLGSGAESRFAGTSEATQHCGSVSTKCLCRICRSECCLAMRARRRRGSGAGRRVRPDPGIGGADSPAGAAPRACAAGHGRRRSGDPAAQRPATFARLEIAHQRGTREHPRRDLRIRSARPRRCADRRRSARRRRHGHRRPFGTEQRRHSCAIAHGRHRRRRLPRAQGDDRPRQAPGRRFAVAVVGGINWGVNSPANHDYDAELRGPVVHNLDRVFSRDLVTCGRAMAVADAVTDPVDRRSPQRCPVRRSVRSLSELIDGARRTLDLELFVLTDTGVVHALEAAALRGVVVRDPARPVAAVERARIRRAARRRHPGALVSEPRGVAPRQGDRRRRNLGALRQRQLVRRRVRAQPRTRHRASRGPAVAAAMLAQMDLDWTASS